MTVGFHRFSSLGKPSKKRLFVMDFIQWAPKGSGTWLFNRDKSPGMVKLRENMTYVHEVAAKLVEDKRQEMMDGAPRKDLLSLLGPSRISFAQHDRRYNFQLSSQGEFCPANGLAAEQ